MAIISFSPLRNNNVTETDSFFGTNRIPFEIVLDAPSTDAVTVQYRTRSASAQPGADYTYTTGTATFAPGETSKIVSVRGDTDGLEEPDRAVVLELFDPSGGTLAGNTATLRDTAFILDDDGAGLKRALFVSSPVLVENDSGFRSVRFEVEISRSYDSPQTFSYATRNGSATAGEDYTATSGTVTFNTGETRKIVSIALGTDARAEPAESFDLVVTPDSSIGAGVEGAVGTALILDDDTSASLPSLAVDADSPLETDSFFGGRVPFVLTLSKPHFDAVTVNYRVLNGTAFDGQDFTAASGSVTFAPGETSKTIQVRGATNNVEEVDKALVLEVFGPSGAVLSGNAPVLRETAFLLDDDGVGQKRGLFVSSPVVVEGDGGNRLARFEVELSRSSDDALSFDYVTRDGSAEAGEDFVARSGSVTFAPGQTRAAVDVVVRGDTLVEGGEFFHLAVTPNSAIGSGSDGAVGTAGIRDDDAGGAAPTLSVSAQNAYETSGFFGNRLAFDVSLDRPASDVVTVQYRTLHGTAYGGTDYAAAEDVLIFAPGEVSKTIRIRGATDNAAEPDKAMALELFDIRGAAFAGGTPVLRETAFLLDDDGVGLKRGLFVSSPVLVEGDGRSGAAVFEIELSRPADQTLTFAYATRDGAARAGQDYTATSGEITFAPGQTTTAVTVATAGDGRPEMTETFDLVVTPTAGVLGDAAAGAAGTATLLDDDAGGGRPTVSAAPGKAVETDSFFGGRIPIVVTLDKPSSDAVRVHYRTQPDTAEAGGDFAAADSSITFAPGETSKTISIRGQTDRTAETDEAFDVEFYRVEGAAFAGGVPILRQTAVILDDDGVNLKRAVYVTNPVVRESDVNGSEAVFEIVATRPFSETTQLRYATVDGSATAGDDYVGRTGSVTFQPGQTSAFARIALIDDFDIDPGEFFHLRIVDPTPTSIVASSTGRLGTARIVDNDRSGGPGNDRLIGTNVAEALWGNGGHDLLAGLGGDDWLFGGTGNDTLNGGPGRDRMNGWTGNDLYLVDNPGDVILEAARGGIDSVRSTLSMTLGPQLENLQLLGSADLDGAGNAANNRITGNAGANRLWGLGGNDTLDGGRGNDVMRGGGGNDRYVVDSAGDRVLEAPGGGVDRIFASVSQGLSATIEHLTLTGGASINGAGNGLSNVLVGNGGRNTLWGLGGNDTIAGGGGNDRLVGGAGNDTLNGGPGNDRMEGGSGNDVYRVNSRFDAVIEGPGGGIDRVESATGFRLGGFVEHLVLVGRAAANGVGNALDNTIIGNGGANVLLGFGGNDVLNGNGGVDRLRGDAGADTFVFDDRTDTGLGARRDSIVDFRHNVDRIDLSGIDASVLHAGDQAFAFRGGAAFGGRPGELVYANGTLSGDVNGDRRPDFQIFLENHEIVDSGDFLL